MNQSINTNQLYSGKFFSFYNCGAVVLPFRLRKECTVVYISDRSSLIPAHELAQLVEIKELFFISLRIIWKRAAYTV